jgi:hypothetical protein
MPAAPLPTLGTWTRRGAVALASALLVACGGGGGGESADACSVPARKAWLRDYMDEWYFWYRISPRPNPEPFDTVGAFFDAILYGGTDPAFPRDRWSGYESTESFNRFFGDGQTLGYGLSVNGLEAAEMPGTPLYVRYVEPLSDAARQGVRRGDEVRSINGVPAADLIRQVADNRFTVLSPTAAGTTVTVVLRSGGVDRTVVVRADVFALTPVAGSAVYTSQGGRKLGYLAVKDMISQAGPGLDAAFQTFRQQGVQDLVLDLRYNGGGLVSFAGTLASYVAGGRGSGQVFASLLYNDKRAGANNTSFVFSNPANSLGIARVFVLNGRRTCSASEQVINGLRGVRGPGSAVGVQVVTIGDTTCGKPVGFLPQADTCGTTYSVVNFESVNALNQGRYWDGFAASCAVAEDWTVPQGAGNDPLVATAAYYADTGSCAPVAAGTMRPLGVRPGRARDLLLDERTDMMGR